MFSEGIVAAVMGRNRHDGARAISSEHIVTYIYRYVLAGDGIDGITACKHTTHLFFNHALSLSLVLYLIKIGVNGSMLISSHHIVHIDALGSQYHEGHTENGVGTRSENQQTLITAIDGESHLSTFAVTDPVALSLLDGFSPLDGVQVAQQTTGISRYPQTPLAHHLLFNRKTSTHRYTLTHLIVGQHSTQLGTPVHHRVTQIGDAIIHEHIVALHLGHGIPLVGSELVGAVRVGIASIRAMFLKMCYQFLDGTGFIEFSVIITLEHFQEGPLCPLVIGGITGAHLTVPVITETYFVQLLAITCNILIGSYLGMLSCLDGILLSGKAISVISHGMQHVKSFQALVTRIDVTGYVAKGMSHVQACSRRIRKHIEHIELGTAIVNFTFVGVMFTPILLPLFLYLIKIIVHFFSIYRNNSSITISRSVIKAIY